MVSQEWLAAVLPGDRPHGQESHMSQLAAPSVLASAGSRLTLSYRELNKCRKEPA